MNSKEKSKREYKARINRVMDYIEKHLDEPIDLSILAGIANFSLFHFHRIFVTVTGETPNSFLQRIRMEKSAQMLLDRDDLTISEIAYRCGFADLSTFSRSFRKYSGTTAKKYRENEKAVYIKNGNRFSKNGKMIGNNCQNNETEKAQLCSVELKNFIIMNTKVEIKEMPGMNVIYVRHTGEFKGIKFAYDKLRKWAEPRGLLQSPDAKILTVYHDDPAVTSADKVRQSACISINKDIKVDGEIGKMSVEGGKFAVARFEITESEFEKAWNTMCLWFTESGYQPDDKNCYEIYYNDKDQHPEQKFIIDICMPVKPL